MSEDLLKKIKALTHSQTPRNPALMKYATIWSLAHTDEILKKAQNDTARFAIAYIAGALDERQRLRNLLRLEGDEPGDDASSEYGKRDE